MASRFTSKIFILKDVFSKSQVSIDFHKTWMSYGKFMLGAYFDFVCHFVFLKK
jgi:hypothetical protein